MSTLTPASPKHTEPIEAKISLKPHQLAMLCRCKDIEEQHREYGILSDKPGAGKTYVILSMILTDPTSTKTTNIIVVPANIYSQWVASIQAFSDNLSYATYVSYEEITELYFTKTLDHTDIILTTAVYYNIVADSLAAADICVKRVFVDEVDSIDKVLTKKIQCDMFWMISASYSKERVDNMSTMFDLSHEDEVTCKCDDSFVDASFGVEPLNTHNYICRSSFLDLMLKNVLDDKELKAAYASDFSLIQRHTYTSIAQNDKEAVLFILKDMLMTIDAETVKRKDYERKGNDITDIEKMSMGECDRIIDQCTDRLSELHRRIHTLHLCVGCMERLDDTTDQFHTSCCAKTLCQACIDKWYSHTLYCPYCREKPEKDTHRIIPPSDTSIVPTTTDTGYTSHDKLGMLIHLLATKTGKKVIVFSDYSKVFSAIREMLASQDVSYVELDAGNVSDLDVSLSKYKNGDVRVLMSNSSFYGCGMNLENTSDIIFYHHTNKEMYAQVIGRAQRPGRQTALQVHNLLYISE